LHCIVLHGVAWRRIATTLPNCSVLIWRYSLCWHIHPRAHPPICLDRPALTRAGCCGPVQIYAKRGVAGYFQGYPATLFRNVFAVSLYFGVYEVAKLNAMQRKQGKASSIDFLAAGATCICVV
jgi:hypothetical protein